MYEKIAVSFNKGFKYTAGTRLDLENLVSTNFAQSVRNLIPLILQIDYWTWHFRAKLHSLNFSDRNQQS